MTDTLDEWADKNAVLLRQNLQANIDVYCDCTHFSAADRAELVRLHLIMVRQWKNETLDGPVPKKSIRDGK